MNKKMLRPISPILVLCFVSLFMASRTEGFDNIRAVQILLIFVSGAMAGLALGIFRAARANRSTEPAVTGSDGPTHSA
jgi:hypothetical protein